MRPHGGIRGLRGGGRVRGGHGRGGRGRTGQLVPNEPSAVEPQLSHAPAVGGVGDLTHAHGSQHTIRGRERSRHLQGSRTDQRAGQGLQAGLAGARGAPRPTGADGGRAARDPTRDRRRGRAHGRDVRGRDAAPEGPRPRGGAQGRREGGPAGDRRGARGPPRLGAHTVGGSRRGLPPRGGAARGPVALDPSRGHDARSVEDGAPGRDRRRLRGGRLLALQRQVHDAHLRGAAGLVAGRVEPAGVPAARGLRLRRLAVQLHGDRRQPLDEPRADGQHGALEAGLDGRTLVLLPDAAVRGGGPPRRA